MGARCVPDDMRDKYFALVDDDLRGERRWRNGDVKAAVCAARQKCCALQQVSGATAAAGSNTARIAETGAITGCGRPTELGHVLINPERSQTWAMSALPSEADMRASFRTSGLGQKQT
jgi:hypothetical protein